MGCTNRWAPTLALCLASLAITATLPAQAIEPEKLLVYYGYPSLINGSTTTTEAASHLSAYDHVIIGDGMQDLAHPDHANILAILAEPSMSGTNVYGYVDVGVTSSNLTLPQIEGVIDDWQAMGIAGVLLDFFGYDFGTSRSRQNSIVNYVHAAGMVAVVDAFTPAHALGSDLDPILNPTGTAPALTTGDVYLFADHQVSANAFVTEGDWLFRADALETQRTPLGVEVFSVTTTNVDDVNAYDETKFFYSWYSALLHGHLATGWGEYEYSSEGTSNGMAPFRTRPAVDAGATYAGAVVNASPLFTRNTDTGTIFVRTDDHTYGFLSSEPILEVLVEGSYTPIEKALVGTPRPTLRITRPPGQPLGTVELHRDDGFAGVGGAGKSIPECAPKQSLDCLAETSSGVFEGTIETLIGTNRIEAFAPSGTVSATMLNYTGGYEDLNGNGTLDLDEDVNENDVLDPGEDLNGNQLLDFDEDVNDDGNLTTTEDFDGNGMLDEGEDMNLNGAIDPVPEGPIAEFPDGGSDIGSISVTCDEYSLRAILLDFEDSATDTQIADFLRTHDLAPIGLNVDITELSLPKLITAEVPAGTDAMELVRTLNGLPPGGLDFYPADVNIPVDPPLEVALPILFAVSPSATVIGEKMPQRLRNGAAVPTGSGNVGEGYDIDFAGFDNDADTCNGGQACDELDITWQHFFMQTFPAHRFLDELLPPPNARPRLAVIDTGLGDGTGTALVDLGTRVVRPMDCTKATKKKKCKRSKLKKIPDQWVSGTLSGDHGTSATVLAAGGGVRVLGLGKDADVRPFKAAGKIEYVRYARALQDAARDSAVRVLLFEYQAPDLDANNDGQITDTMVAGCGGMYNERKYAIDTLNSIGAVFRAGIKSARTGKKIVVLPAGNYFTNTDYTYLAGPLTTPQGNLKPLFDVPVRGTRSATSGSSLFLGVSNTTVTNAPRGGEARGASSNFGTRISVGAPGDKTMGQKPDQTFRRFGGTSAAAPQVAGLASMLVYFNRNFYPAGQRFSRYQVVELIEATADDLGTSSDDVDAEQKNDIPGNGADDAFGYGRINAWKAMLSAVNGGLSEQFGRTDADEDDKDDTFKSLELIPDEDTTWYGFEIVTSLRAAEVWIDDEQLVDPESVGPDGTEDSDDDFMPYAPEIRAYKGVRSDRPNSRGTHVDGDGFADDLTPSIAEDDAMVGIVPAGTTVAGRGQYVIHFSIKREDLFRTDGTMTEVPRTLSIRSVSAHGEPDPIYNLRLETDKMRTGEVSGVTFDDFVFQIVPPDYGDAPIGPGLLTENGARHMNTTHEWLSFSGLENRFGVSAEHNADTGDSKGGDASVDTDGIDNRDGGFQDRDGRDDGVRFYPLSWVAGGTAQLDFGVAVADINSARYSNEDDRSLWVNIWIDWNTDGDWDEANEHAVQSVQILPGTSWTVLSNGSPGATPTTIPTETPATHSAIFRSTISVPGAVGNGPLWARARLDYGENAGRNDPRPLFRSLPSLRDPALAQGVDQPAGAGFGYTAGAARYGEVEDYLIGVDFGDALGYPTLRADNGARHLVTRYEWLGAAVTREFDANGAFEVDGEPNLNPDDDDAAEMGVDFPDGPLIRGAQTTITITVSTSATSVGISPAGGFSIPREVGIPDDDYDSLPRYQNPNAKRRIYVSGWADWNGDGDWEDAGEKIVDLNEINPLTWGPDNRYTLGEDFEDVNGNGVYDDAENFIDQNSNGMWDTGEPLDDRNGNSMRDLNYTEAFGASTKEFSQTFVVPANTANDVRFRFRLSYGENDAADLTHPLREADELPSTARAYAESVGGALFGEVEDYPKSVTGPVPVCGDGQLDTGEDCDDGNTQPGDCCSAICTYEVVGSFCDDGNACTSGETCNGAGSCTGGDGIICNDGNVCTNDSCNPSTGCVFSNNTASCSDGNPCTSGDVCSGGTCTSGPPVPNCGGSSYTGVPALSTIGLAILGLLMGFSLWWFARRA